MQRLSVQVIERARDIWAEHPEWAKLGERVEFASGDFFKAGVGLCYLSSLQAFP